MRSRAPSRTRSSSRTTSTSMRSSSVRRCRNSENDRDVSMNAQHKIAVVTGASSGIGLGIAKALLARGWNVVGSARTQPRLDEAAARLDAGERFFGVAGDIAAPATAKRLLDSAIERFGHVDLLVNNAGIFLPKPFVEFTPEEVEQQIATNVKGVVFASQE